MPFKNRIRVPLVFRNTQFPIEEELFTKSNGDVENIFTIISKTYQGVTDQLPDFLHQRILVALTHDEVNIESDKFVGQIVKQGGYQIEWQNFLNYPLGVAEFTARVTPFNASNFNCATCNEYSQIDLENDSFYADLEEGETASLSVFDNDSICCNPFTAEITYWNSGYLAAIPTIDEETGEVTVTVKNPVSTGSNILIAKYRVTCENGQYDEANIYANINGSIETCEPVGTISSDAIFETEATIEWVASGSAVNQYNWALYLASDITTPVQTGSTTSLFVNLTGLTPGTNYTFAVTVDCLYNENDSTTETFDFSTQTVSGEGSCGVFTFYNDGFPSPASVPVSYFDCNGLLQHENVGTNLTRCLLMNSPGNPTYLVIHPGGSWEYLGLCDQSYPVQAVIGSSIFDCCSNPFDIVYILEDDFDIDEGVAVYLDIALSIPAGSGYIKNLSGEVFHLISGIVGSSTGTIC